MRKKLLYEAPDSEALVFRMEGNFCQTVIPNSVTMGKFGGDDPNDFLMRLKKNGDERYEKDFLTDRLPGPAGGGVQQGKGCGSSE